MARAHIEKRPRVTNTKGPTRLWVPNSEFVFADMLVIVHLSYCLDIR